jgi:hypothetical protein
MPLTFTYEKDRKDVHGYFPAKLYEAFVKRAKQNKRSLNAELNAIVEKTVMQEERQEQQTWLPALEHRLRKS